MFAKMFNFHNLTFFRVKQQGQADHLSARLSLLTDLYSAVRSSVEKVSRTTIHRDCLNREQRQ